MEWAKKMRDPPPGHAATATAAKQRSNALLGVPTGLPLCLIVSPSLERSRLFERAAELHHWQTLVSHEATDAMQLATRYRVRLALVDLQSVPAVEMRAFRALVKRLATTDGPLLVVCGKENDAKGEVWSRKLGVWMYLPGVNDHTNLDLLCAQARSVVEKFDHQLVRTPQVPA